MLRRTRVPLGTSLSGNGVVGIRREDKNVWERRVPLTPTHVQHLLKKKLVDRVIVQPSSTRCFRNEAYEEAGADLKEDLSEAGTIVAVKEVPAQLLLPDRTYMFFSHTIKAQAYNMPLLDTIVSKNIRLLDYERILGPDGRIVKFGPYAGYAGMIDTLHALGLAMLMRGFATPFVQVSLSKEYRSLETARADLRVAGEIIRKEGLPKEMCPLVIGVTGSGSVSLAAQEILHLLPCKYVEPEALPRLWNQASIDNHFVYVCVIRAKDMVVPKDTTRPFSRKEYFETPEDFAPVFHENIAPYLRVLINGMYWEPRFPRLLTTKQSAELAAENRFPLLALGDITCDIGGSVEFFVKATTIQNPLYAYDVVDDKVIDIHNFEGKGVVILGVDHLPAEFPIEASTSFGDGLAPLMPMVASSADTVALEEQKKALGEPLFDATVTCQGSLTPNYNYITEMRRKRDESRESSKKKQRVLVFGSGLVAGPCVEHLFNTTNCSVTVVDGSNQSMSTMVKNFNLESAPDLGGEEKHQLRCVQADLSKVDDYVENLVKSADVVISMLPPFMHPTVAECTIKNKKPLVTASYVSPAMQALGPAAEANDIYVVNELGLDPGIDIMTSAKMINAIKAQGGVVKKYVSLCGALPQPENSNCPMGYKFSWAPRGVLIATQRPARFLMGAQWHEIKPEHLYYYTSPITAFSGLNLHWLPNGNAERYEKLYGIEGADTIVRGTFRYSGFAPVVRAFYLLNLVDDKAGMPELQLGNNKLLSWAGLLRRAIPKGIDSGNLVNDLAEYIAPGIKKAQSIVAETSAYKALQEHPVLGEQPSLHSEGSTADEVSYIISSLDEMGFLSTTKMVPKTQSGLIVDSVAHVLQHVLKYSKHERDLVLMHHRITAFYPEENKTRITEATLTKRGEDTIRSGTAQTVGLPVGIVAKLALDGVLEGKKGLLDPTDPTIYEPSIKELERFGIRMNERTFDA